MGFTGRLPQERRVVARAALVPTLGADFGVLSMDLVRLEPVGVSNAWLYAYLRYSRFADHLKQHANGANVLHLTPDRIREHMLAVPPAKLSSEFAARIDPLLALQNLLEDRVDNLTKARDLLLSRFVRGPPPMSEAA